MTLESLDFIRSDLLLSLNNKCPVADAVKKSDASRFCRDRDNVYLSCHSHFLLGNALKSLPLVSVGKVKTGGFSPVFSKTTPKVKCDGVLRFFPYCTE